MSESTDTPIGYPYPVRFSLVMKVGGACLADGEAVRRVCDLVRASADASPILVVSAHEGVTCLLEECAQQAARGTLKLEAVRIRHKGLLRELGLEPELLDRLVADLGQVLFSISERRAITAEELDFVLSFGERMSARIVSAALRQRGISATPVDAYDLGLTTDSCHGHARPLPGLEASLRRSLEEIPGLPVVTGFLAKDGRGNLTTLGRNGSDLTAALVARAVGAERLVFWKCVEGVLDADPGLVPEADIVAGVSMREAAALAFHGAAVLHPSTLLPLLDTELTVEVRDFRSPLKPGSCFDQRELASGLVAIAGMPILHGLRVRKHTQAMPATLFSLLHAHHVSPRYLHVAMDAITVYAPPGPGLEILARKLSEHATSLEPLASVVLIGGRGGELCARALQHLRAERLEPERMQLDRDGVCQLLLFQPDQRAAAVRILHRELLAPVSASPGQPSPS